MTIIAPECQHGDNTGNRTKYDKLVSTLLQCELIAKSRHLTIGQMLEELGDAGYCFICILLSIPFLQPISVGPIAMASGLSFTAIGWQLWQGKHSPWLPLKLRNIELSPKNWHRLIKLCLWVLKWCNRITRPRLQRLVAGTTGRKIVAALIMAGGLLMAIPFVAVPLNNTFPAYTILFACIGDLEDDGLMVFVALFWFVVTIVYFAFVFYVIYYLGMNVMDLARGYLAR